MRHESNPSTLTPMLRQYYELKKQHPGTLLFFRLGDFYELFFDDAVTGSRELEITLTARQKERGNPVPMCGVPHHAAANYIAKLVRKGFRVAICEQTEDPAKAKKLVRREVVRVITPGTAVDPQLLESRESAYLAAVCGTGQKMGAAFLDLSTGEFCATEATGNDAWKRIRADLESFAPREILFPASLEPLVRSETPHTVPLPLDAKAEQESRINAPNNPASGRIDASLSPATLTPIDDWTWTLEASSDLLKQRFGVRELTGYGLENKHEAIRAAGVCLKYAQDTQKATAAHVNDVTYFEALDHLVLDAVTIRNLELVESLGEGRNRSLLDVIDSSVTGMGGRLLRSWLLRPSIKKGEIETRLEAVAELYGTQLKRDRIRRLLKSVADLERLVGRLNMSAASPRDLVALRTSLEQVPKIKQVISDSDSSLLQVLNESANELNEVRQLIEAAIGDDPPLRVSDGGAIRSSFSAELDEVRSISQNAKQTIASMEARERERSGITSLRIKFNNVFGYFIEVSKSNLPRVPADYERRQTLANAERFTTPELKSWESKVLGAEDRITKLEAEIFSDVCSKITAETRELQATARALAMLDSLAALAETAVRRRYSRPVVHDGDEIEIVQGRHPIIEAFNDEPFIPNDLYMNNSTDRLVIITGPNMGGKSTCLRQTALIVILAQMGSFVPADRARVPVVDRIWTRVGASDDLARGRSTFMVEMTETAAILHNATARSLIVLDEIGRGTSTFDGLSIAWAVAEYLHDSSEHSGKTLFATHYHELTELAERLPGAKNYQIIATEREGEVVFLHKLVTGAASKSYGIEVAKLAGIPFAVIDRAREVLRRLERYELDVFAEDGEAVEPMAAAASATGGGLEVAVRRAQRKKIALQATLFDIVNQALLDEFEAVDVESLTDDELRNFVRSIRKRLV